MAYITDYQYYENGGNAPEDANWGSYQYVSLQDIVNNFLLMYSGNHSLVNNEETVQGLIPRQASHPRAQLRCVQGD